MNITMTMTITLNDLNHAINIRNYLNQELDNAIDHNTGMYITTTMTMTSFINLIITMFLTMTMTMTMTIFLT